MIRCALRSISTALALFLLSLRRPQQTTLQLATLMSGDTLLDFAARNTGNFEDWQTVAQINNLTPPYPGPTNLADAGHQLIVPQTGAAVIPGAPLPTYSANVLGIDVDFGPINGTMPTWTGDYNLIAGFPNFARAIGRRLQTPLGSLIYHSTFGCRIPAEIGAIQGITEAARLAAFGTSALLADPRTGEVRSASASVSGQSVGTFTGVVLPIGPNATPILVNETINPLV